MRSLSATQESALLYDMKQLVIPGKSASPEMYLPPNKVGLRLICIETSGPHTLVMKQIFFLASELRFFPPLDETFSRRQGRYKR